MNHLLSQLYKTINKENLHFSAESIKATERATQLLTNSNPERIIEILKWFFSCAWHEISKEEQLNNFHALFLGNGKPISSRYHMAGECIFLIKPFEQNFIVICHSEEIDEIKNGYNNAPSRPEFKTQFQGGNLNISPCVYAVTRNSEYPQGDNHLLRKFIGKYFSCDWGENDIHEQLHNYKSLLSGNDHIFARYSLPNNNKIFFYTEVDRSVTSIYTE